MQSKAGSGIGFPPYVSGDVLAVHADPQYMDEKKKFHLNDAKPLVYSHGEYLGIGKKLGTFGYSVKKKKKKSGKKKQ